MIEQLVKARAVTLLLARLKPLGLEFECGHCVILATEVDRQSDCDLFYLLNEQLVQAGAVTPYWLAKSVKVRG